MNEFSIFIELVSKMRASQKAFFKYHKQTDLQRSKFLEHQVDAQIEKFTKGKQVAEQLTLTPSE